MFLAIDIGNTNVTLGVYDDERLRATWRLATVHDRMSDEYGILLTQLLEHKGISCEGVSGIAIASVVQASRVRSAKCVWTTWVRIRWWWMRE